MTRSESASRQRRSVCCTDCWYIGCSSGAPLAALANPVIEWSSKEEEIAEEGCLSLPSVHVEVERPVHVRVRAQDEYGEVIMIEASGLEARVIQHEMDHLDGVLILDRTPRDQRKEAMRVLREWQEQQRSDVRTVYLGTSAFAAAVLRRLYASPHRPTLVISRPDSPQGRGRKLTPPPTVDVARELGLDVYQPESVNSEAALARIAAAEPEALCVCAFGALIKEPLLSAYPILNVHPSLLPRWRGAAPIERAILAGRHARRASRSCRLTAGLDSGPVCLQAAGADRGR